MAHMALYVEDDCVAVANPVACVPDPFTPFADSHTPWAGPLREHKTDPAKTMGDSEAGPDLHHVRVVGNKAKRHGYDAGLYFSGCHDTQTFWAPAGKGGGGYMGGPEVTRPDQRQWELEKAATLRKFVDRLDDVWARTVDHAWEKPGAQYVSLWAKDDGIPDVMPTPPGVNIGEGPPCLVSARVRDKLVETMRAADRERQVRKGLAEARLRKAELEVQARKYEHAGLGKQAGGGGGQKGGSACEEGGGPACPGWTQLSRIPSRRTSDGSCKAHAGLKVASSARTHPLPSRSSVSFVRN